MIKKTGKKSWYKVKEPKILRGQVIGELTAFDPQSVIGRKLSLNLMSITDNPKLQQIDLNFLIDGIENNELKASITGYSFSTASIKRLVKRGSKRVDDSYECKTKDNFKVRIKSFFVTRSYTSNLIGRKIRKTARENTIDMVSKLDFDTLINDTLDHKLQNDLKKLLNKVHPLKACEIRVLEKIIPAKAEEKTDKPSKK